MKTKLEYMREFYAKHPHYQRDYRRKRLNRSEDYIPYSCRIGIPLSEETRRKISESRKGKYGGEKDPMYHKIQSEEGRKRISIANKNRIITEETRKKLSQAAKGRKLSDEAKMKLRLAKLGKHHLTEEAKKRISEKLLGSHPNLSKERRERLGANNRGKHIPEEVKEKIREKLWERLQNPSKRQKWVNSLKVKPTKPESQILKICKKFFPNFEYVGDFKFWIKTKNPDFVDKAHKMIIEFDGSYWHRNKQRDNERNRIYAENGYALLSITDADLLDESKLIQKIKEFTSKYGANNENK